jgi:hypothetical protein
MPKIVAIRGKRCAVSSSAVAGKGQVIPIFLNAAKIEKNFGKKDFSNVC